ncbi:MAG: hypothetical protein ACLR6I_04445 [Waltera sp.]
MAVASFSADGVIICYHFGGETQGGLKNLPGLTTRVDDIIEYQPLIRPRHVTVWRYGDWHWM